MNKKLHTAAEIAQMRLPGLPTTKANVILRAEKEQWHFEEGRGVGGARRLYEIPTKYLPVGDWNQVGADDATRGTSMAPPRLLRTIAAGSKDVDTKILADVVEALEAWAKARGVEIPAERKAALIAVLYDYVSKGADAERVNQFLQALG